MIGCSRALLSQKQHLDMSGPDFSRFSTFLYSSAGSDTCTVPLPPNHIPEAKDGRNRKFWVLDTCPLTPLPLFFLEPSRKKNYQKFQGMYYMAL